MTRRPSPPTSSSWPRNTAATDTGGSPPSCVGQAGAVNAKRVQRIWRREGLKVPQKHPKRGRLWLNDGSCVRLRASWPNHVWSYDFVEARTHEGKKFRMLCLIDEFTREALAIRVKRKLNSTDVLETPGRRHDRQGNTDLHTLRQRPRVHRPDLA